jgi:hypothetical protein
MSWIRTEYDEFVDITPRGEETMHIADEVCECRPRLSRFNDGRWLLIHRTFDGADGFERIERGLNEFYQGRRAA